MPPSVNLQRQPPAQHKRDGPITAARWPARPAHPNACATTPRACHALLHQHDATPAAWNGLRPILQSGGGATQHPQMPHPTRQIQAPSPDHSCGGGAPHHQ
eukprot:6752602-Karenia_brevis.AAC.1